VVASEADGADASADAAAGGRGSARAGDAGVMKISAQVQAVRLLAATDTPEVKTGLCSPCQFGT
jgi:hypothetical protein